MGSPLNRDTTLPCGAYNMARDSRLCAHPYGTAWSGCLLHLDWLGGWLNGLACYSVARLATYLDAVPLEL